MPFVVLHPPPPSGSAEGSGEGLPCRAGRGEGGGGRRTKVTKGPHFEYSPRERRVPCLGVWRDGVEESRPGVAAGPTGCDSPGLSRLDTHCSLLGSF